MATVMEVETVSGGRPARRPYFSAIRWGAIIAGVVSGSASYLLLTLLGIAVGLTAVDPNSAEPVGRVPLATGIWTGVSMLVGAFIGGYVAGHMSGLSRSMDGMLHGFVSWGVTTLLYLVLATTAIGAILGGTFRIISQGTQIAAQGAAGAAQSGGGQNVVDQLAGMITGSGQGQGQVSAESLSSVQQAIQSGDREGAINIMVNEMGFQRDRAVQVVDKMSGALNPQNVRQTAEQATDVLTTTSWWLFIGLLLSLALGIAGGASGVKASANRLVGDHTNERHTHL
jgi:hypothetical protein